MAKFSASILSADFTQLGEDIRRAEAGGADMIDVDVMDGRFVPNLTIGPFIVEAARTCTSLPLDVHLMIVEPERMVHEFISAGASILTVHQEACIHLQATLAQIRTLGARPGVALCPSTPTAVLEDVVDDFDLLLVMTVNPGFGGQEMIPNSIRKLTEARRLLEQWGSRADLEVDGGVNPETGHDLVAAGADVLVAGSAIFSNRGIEDNIARLREAGRAAAGNRLSAH